MHHHVAEVYTDPWHAVCGFILRPHGYDDSGSQVVHIFLLTQKLRPFNTQYKLETNQVRDLIANNDGCSQECIIDLD